MKLIVFLVSDSIASSSSVECAGVRMRRGDFSLISGVLGSWVRRDLCSLRRKR